MCHIFLAHIVSGKKTYFIEHQFTGRSDAKNRQFMTSCHFLTSVLLLTLDVVFARQVCCKNNQLHTIRSKKLAGGGGGLFNNTRETLKETDKLSFF